MGGLAEKVKKAVKAVGTAIQVAFNWLFGKQKTKIEDQVISILEKNKDKISKSNNKVQTCKIISQIKSIDIMKKSALNQFNKLSLHDQEIVKGLYDLEFDKEMGEIHNHYKENKNYYNFYGNEYQYPCDLKIAPQMKINRSFYQNRIYQGKEEEDYRDNINEMIKDLLLSLNNYKYKNNNIVYNNFYINRNYQEKEFVMNKMKIFSKNCKDCLLS